MPYAQQRLRIISSIACTITERNNASANKKLNYNIQVYGTEGVHILHTCMGHARISPLWSVPNVALTATQTGAIAIVTCPRADSATSHHTARVGAWSWISVLPGCTRTTVAYRSKRAICETRYEHGLVRKNSPRQAGI